jgi:hypothetical protein
MWSEEDPPVYINSDNESRGFLSRLHDKCRCTCTCMCLCMQAVAVQTKSWAQKLLDPFFGILEPRLHPGCKDLPDRSNQWDSS